MKALLHFIVGFLILSPSLGELCNTEDKKVLLKIKKALHNPYHLVSWDPKTDCCTWYCVHCHDTTHRIDQLNIFSGDINGQIPPEVGDLPFLDYLVFRKLTNLTGTIPPTIAKLKNLVSLTLSWTDLSGPVPGFLSQLKNLDYLDLSFNKLSGTIPSSFSSFPKLRTLHLDRNKLTGSIPESFGSFRGEVPDLFLSHNQLAGKLPVSLGKMQFRTIDLSWNRLQGDASMLFNTQTMVIILSRNSFEFDLSKVKLPISLVWLDLSHNRIRGSLPAGLARLQLQFLNVSYNFLCGKIPDGEELGRFDSSSYFHNRCLCGAPLQPCKLK